MRLKVLCWTLAFFTAFLLLAWPSLIGLPPRGASRLALKRYAVQSTWYIGAIVISFLGTTICAALVVRNTRQDYVRDSAANLRSLIEGTLEDHRKKSGPEEPPS